MYQSTPDIHKYVYVSNPGLVRVVLVWNSHTSNHYGVDRLDSDLDLWVYNPYNQLVGYSISADNNYEVVEFNAWSPGYYRFDVRKDRFDSSWEYYAMAWSNKEYTTSSGSLGGSGSSRQHTFFVPEHTSEVHVRLYMDSGVDFDLSVWDSLNRRTGGWWQGQHYIRETIHNSKYGGYSLNPEWVWVAPARDNGQWKTGPWSFRGSGSYTIYVYLI